MPRLIDIGDDYLHAICHAFTYYEAEYYNAKKIIKWVEEKRGLDPEYEALRELIEIIEKAYYAHDKCNAEELAALVETYLPKYPEQIDLNILALDIAGKKAAASGNFSAFRQRAEKAWELFPENGDILKYLADAHAGSAGIDKNDIARNMYESALAITENGLTKKAILDILEGSK
jgi:hypothetical protein